MNLPLVSIIIPSYNSKRFIKEAVNSAVQQTYKNIEVVLVDDGSTDGTEVYFEEFQKQAVHCFKIHNGGASNARNFGLSKSKGEYIQFLDADDILHQNKIENQMKAMLYQNADISFTPWINFSKNVTEGNKFRFDKINYVKTRSGKELMFSFGMDNWFIPVFSWITHKNLIEKAGGWNIEISNNDDGEYFSRLLFHAEKVICIDEILAYYRVMPTNSLSKMNSTHKIDDAFESYRLITALMATNSEPALLSYPKRLYYMQFLMIRTGFPEQAKRAAKVFDSINADCFLSKEYKYWLLIKLFGLYKGTLLYEFVIKITAKIKALK
jgi:glycosyltransferase involved in cell wall biosynthesis